MQCKILNTKYIHCKECEKNKVKYTLERCKSRFGTYRRCSNGHKKQITIAEKFKRPVYTEEQKAERKKYFLEVRAEKRASAKNIKFQGIKIDF